MWYSTVEFNLSLLWKRETKQHSPLLHECATLPPPSLALLVHRAYDLLVWKPNSNLTLLCFSNFQFTIPLTHLTIRITLGVWWQKEPVTCLRRGSLETSLLRLMRVTERKSQLLLLMAFSSSIKKEPPWHSQQRSPRKYQSQLVAKHQRGSHP